MNDDEVEKKSVGTDGSPAASSALVRRIDDFCAMLGSVTSLLSNPERAAAAGDIGVLEVALHHFADARVGTATTRLRPH